MPGTRKLGKTTDQRMAMLRQQVTDFLDKGKMETTVTRAKEIKPLAEKMITLGKKSDLAAYRQAMSFITREDVWWPGRSPFPQHPRFSPPRTSRQWNPGYCTGNEG